MKKVLVILVAIFFASVSCKKKSDDGPHKYATTRWDSVTYQYNPSINWTGYRPIYRDTEMYSKQEADYWTSYYKINEYTKDSAITSLASSAAHAGWQVTYSKWTFQKL